MKTYRLKANRQQKGWDLDVRIDGLIPIPHKRQYTFEELLRFIDYVQYEPDWTAPMDAEYEILYGMHNNQKINFFLVENDGIIVMPGTYLYPTVLTLKDIEDLDSYSKHI